MLQGKNMIVVTELPVGLWTQKFKENLEKMISGESKKKHNIRYYNSCSTDTTVCFEITLEDPEKYDIKKMDLTSTINTTNMVLYDKNFKLKKYNDPREIIADYVEVGGISMRAADRPQQINHLQRTRNSPKQAQVH